MFEIGSEYWTMERENGDGLKSIVPDEHEIVYTLCGRTALDIVLRDIISQRSAKKVYMPSYCCHTMLEPFIRNNILVEFYNVCATDKGIECQFQENDCDIIFLIEYFGFRNFKVPQFAMDEKTKGKTIIYDSTHTMFCKNVDYTCYDYTIGSFRKWIGVNAGFAGKKGKWLVKPSMSQNSEYIRLRNRGFDLKAKYIRNNESYDDKEEFLSLFKKAEELIEDDYLNYAPDTRSQDLLKTADVINIQKRRKSNAKILMRSIIENKNIRIPYQEVREDECPLFVPIMLKDCRDSVQKYFIERSIYLPKHWPISQMHRLSFEDEILYKEELSLICDQRYDGEDMKRIAKELVFAV